MVYSVQKTVVRNPWVFWSVSAIFWLILTVIAWSHINWLLRVVLILFLLIPLFGVFSSLKPNLSELLVDDDTIFWGTRPDEIIDIRKIQRIVLDEDRGMTFFELEDERLLTKLPWMFDGRKLCDYIKRNYPQVEIESKPDRTTD